MSSARDDDAPVDEHAGRSVAVRPTIEPTRKVKCARQDHKGHADRQHGVLRDVLSKRSGCYPGLGTAATG